MLVGVGAAEVAVCGPDEGLDEKDAELDCELTGGERTMLLDGVVA